MQAAQPGFALMALGFRPFFLLGSAYGVWALLRWVLHLDGSWPWGSPVSMMSWHSHEMFFGFAAAIVYGFLLTAAQNWTGVDSLSGRPLALLVGAWVLARVLANVEAVAAWLLMAALDTGVILAVMLALWRMLKIANNRRNRIFLPFLCVLALLNLACAGLAVWPQGDGAYRVNLASMWAFVWLLSLLGGRVIPFFIERRLQQPIAREPVWQVVLQQGGVLLLLLLSLLNPALSLLWPLCAALALSHSLRLYQWHVSGLWREPMLWSLWLSYGFLPLGLWLFCWPETSRLALHSLTVGLLGGLVLAMISRVSLGHTGRPRRVPRAHYQWVFIGVISAALLRVLLPWGFPQLSVYAWWGAVLAWGLAYAGFVLVYAPFLLRVRADGKPG